MASIEKRSDTTYRITVSCGYDKRGKKLFKKKTVSLAPTLTEKQKEKKLNELAVLFEKEVSGGTYLDGEKITLEEFTEIWFRDYAEKELAPSTLNPYKLRLEKRIIPALGHIKLAKLQPHHLLEFYNNLNEAGVRLDALYVPTKDFQKTLNNMSAKALGEMTGVYRKTFSRMKEGKGVYKETAQKLSDYFEWPLNKAFFETGNDKTLSSKTVRHHHILISSILSTAVKWNIIQSNPAERVKPPKMAKSKTTITENYYSDEQVIELFLALENEPVKYKTLIYLTIDTGLRLSEVAGLEWSAIDLDNKQLDIAKQRQYVSHYGILEREPKSESGIRDITVSDMVVDMLKKYQVYQKTMRVKCGSAWFHSDNVFTHEDGKPIFPNRPSIWLADFLKRKELPKITFHGLRHYVDCFKMVSVC